MLENTSVWDTPMTCRISGGKKKPNCLGNPGKLRWTERFYKYKHTHVQTWAKDI